MYAGGTASGERSLAIDGAPTEALEGVNEGSRASRQISGLVVDHVEVALNPESAKTHSLQPSGGQFAARRIDRHESHAEPGHHGLLDSFRVTELERPADSE